MPPPFINSLRRKAVVVLVVLVWFPGASTATAAPCWQPPVLAPAVDPFRQPGCPWCPGNRGIEFGTTPGEEVTSVAAGSVTFAGSIAGTRYVVVEVAGGWRITYGNLAGNVLRAGDAVVAGMPIGEAAGSLHFGLRDGDDYIDPAPYLGEWHFRVRLVPTDGSAASPSPPPSLRCAADERAAGEPVGGEARSVRRERALRR